MQGRPPRAAGWERRDVVHRFENGWTVERVTTLADLQREGLLMRNCLQGQAKVYFACVEAGLLDILSLRDPKGGSHVEIVLEDGVVIDGPHGKCLMPPKPRYTNMVVEFLQQAGFRGWGPMSQGHRWHWVHPADEPELAEEPDTTIIERVEEEAAELERYLTGSG